MDRRSSPERTPSWNDPHQAVVRQNVNHPEHGNPGRRSHCHAVMMTPVGAALSFTSDCAGRGEAAMATGPGRGQALGAAGFGHLRASHADREQVIEALKAAFVQGRLTKDELEARAGRAFAARTYAELAALTTDLPAGLADAMPPRVQAGRPLSNATKVGIWLTIAVAVPVVLSFLGGGQLFLL